MAAGTHTPGRTAAPDISILGYGLDADRHLTPECRRLLARCRTAYVVGADRGLRRVLRDLGLRCRDLSPLYREGAPRADVYAAVAGVVLGAASRRAGVAYLTYGHPSLLDSVVERILDGAHGRGLSVHVETGVSFVDVLLTAVPQPSASLGYQVVEATALVTRRLTLCAALPCFVAQIGAFADHTATGTTPPSRLRLERLVRYLRRYYPARHPALLCEAEPGRRSPWCVPITLAALPRAAAALSYATTLYLPALPAAPTAPIGSGAAAQETTP